MSRASNRLPGLILLDRDGVLNRVVVDSEHGTIDSPLNPGQVEILPGVPEALARLTRAGFTLAIVSNQPSAAKGKTTRENLERAHAKVLERIQAEGAKIASSHLCFHQSEDACACRKPKTGLLEEAFRANPGHARETSWMVGDGVTDVQAGAAFGVRTAFLGPWKCDARRVFDAAGVSPDEVCGDLPIFVERVLGSVEEKMSEFVQGFLEESVELIRKLDVRSIEQVAQGLSRARGLGGRLFILGVGGSAGHASHACNDFRKICGFEAYAPTDNVSELTARINDEGWDTCFAEWLKGCRMSSQDAVLVFSVGGGNREKNISVNLVRALELAKDRGAAIFGIVGKDGGFTKQVADACVVVPVVSQERITPHTEGFCAVIWHLLVSHPALKFHATKWESVR